MRETTVSISCSRSSYSADISLTCPLLANAVSAVSVPVPKYPPTHSTLVFVHSTPSLPRPLPSTKVWLQPVSERLSLANSAKQAKQECRASIPPWPSLSLAGWLRSSLILREHFKHQLPPAGHDHDHDHSTTTIHALITTASLRSRMLHDIDE